MACTHRQLEQTKASPYRDNLVVPVGAVSESADCVTCSL